MKAAQLDRYAKAGRLVVREVPVPEPAANEVLVKVRAAAVNPLELLLVVGSVRLIQDYRLPQTLGNECSGVVERVGSKVGKFRPGDAVYTRLPLERIGPLPSTSPWRRPLWRRCLPGMRSMWRPLFR